MGELIFRHHTATTCPYCGVGCGVVVPSAGTTANPPSSMQGDPQHPANFGKLCVKGSALQETLTLEERALHPQLFGQQVTWDKALNHIANEFNRIQREHGPGSIAFYVSGQLLTEDYYVANKFMKGFLGSAHIDTNSRLCMSSAVAGYKRAFGSDTVPNCYEDLDDAELLVLTGSNAAWTHPVLFQRMRRNRQNNADCRVVLIDPRQTASAELADLHLAIKPGTDAWLFNGLLSYLASQNKLNRDYIARYTEGFSAALAHAQHSAPNIKMVASICQVDEADVETFYRWFTDTDKALTFFSQGINQSSTGVDKCNAIINCHLASGKIGYSGAGPFSITGQPNAMGGREVGGLANQLAAHMDFHTPDAIDRIGGFWNAPHMAQTNGYKALDLFKAIGSGEIKAVWIMSTNPMVSLPDAQNMRKALAKCDLVVVSDSQANTDTTQLAHVLLPALTWGEKDGTVTNSERRISRQRAFLPAPGEARADWWIISEVARRMGHTDAFAYQSPHDIFVEHAKLSGLDNNGTRDFDISGLSQLSAAEYDALTPIQWPVNARFPQGRKRFFDDGHFFTSSGKAQFIPIDPSTPLQQTSAAFPWLLNTGRVRDQWHTMTRTARASRLLQHVPEPFCALHPDDATELDLKAGDIVRVYNQRGSLLVRAQLSTDQQRGQLFIPIHWNDQYSASAVVSSLVAAIADPISGQPESKQAAVAVERYNAQCHGLLIANQPLALPRSAYWSSVRLNNLWLYEWVSDASPEDCSELLQPLMPNGSDTLQFSDAARNEFRQLKYQQHAIVSAMQLSCIPNEADRQWLWQLLSQQDWSREDFLNLLAGRSATPRTAQGAIVCACFQVGKKPIQEAIQAGCISVESLGQSLRCGTNCGSCIPELKQLLAG